MSDTSLRRIIALAIALLLIYQMGAIVTGLFGMVWGVLSALLVAIVTFLATRLAKAGGASSVWFLLPTLLFTVVPLALKIWGTFTEPDVSWVSRAAALVPFVIGFAAPVLLLLLAYNALRVRSRRDGTTAPPPERSNPASTQD
jgi:hypothetical protein